jgi:hypothetical protein
MDISTASTEVEIALCDYLENLTLKPLDVVLVSSLAGLEVWHRTTAQDVRLPVIEDSVHIIKRIGLSLMPGLTEFQDMQHVCRRTEPLVAMEAAELMMAASSSTIDGPSGLSSSPQLVSSPLREKRPRPLPLLLQDDVIDLTETSGSDTETVDANLQCYVSSIKRRRL